MVIAALVKPKVTDVTTLDVPAELAMLFDKIGGGKNQSFDAAICFLQCICMAVCSCTFHIYNSMSSVP